MGTVETFVRLFRGRGDAYGTWAGGCVRKPLTADHFEQHLYSHNPLDWIGVYNVMGTACSWGAVDIDVDDHPLAERIQMCLRHESIPAWIEKTTRGYHVWVFPADVLVNASMMRRAMTAACLAVEYQPKEVYPKQDQASGHNLGNYLRLPLNGSASNPAPLDCRRFVHDGVTLMDMDMHRASTAHLERLASHIVLPQTVDEPVDVEAGLEVQWEIEQIGGPAYRVWRDGPQYGHDRSSTLSRLAHRLAEADVERKVAAAILLSADQRWGKFSTRGESGMAALWKIVQQAYARQTA